MRQEKESFLALALQTVKRPLFWMGLSFLSTIAVFLCFPFELSLLLVVFLMGGYCLLAQGSLRRFLPLLLACAALGFVVLEMHSQRAYRRVSPMLNQPILVTLLVETAEHRGMYHRYEGEAKLEGAGFEIRYPITISGFSEEPFSPGETLRCEASVYQPPQSAQALMTEGLTLRITKLFAWQEESDFRPIAASLLRCKSFLSKRITSFVPGEAGAVLRAMLTGDRTGLSTELNDAFRRSGLSHLLVVSGLHLVILSSFLSSAIFFFPERLRAGILLLFCWLFALMTGAGSSIVRAAVMLSITQIGPLLGRRGDTLTSLTVAGVLMVACNPAMILSVSFLLSFGAVAGLALFCAPLEEALCPKQVESVAPLQHMVKNLATGLSAQLGAAPALAGVFGLLPCLGIVANLLVIEGIAPLMTLGVLALLCSFIYPPLATVLFAGCKGLVWLLIYIARTFSSLPFAQIGISSYWQLVGLLGGLLLLALLVAKRPGKAIAQMAVLGFGAVFLSVSLVSVIMSRSYCELLWTESGLAAVVQGPRAVVLGAPDSLWDAQQLEQAFSRLGVTEIEGMLLAPEERARLPAARLLWRFGKPSRLSAKPDLSHQRFAQEAGLTLYQTTKEPRLFGAGTLVWEEDGWRLSFSDATLLNFGEECVIIGAYRSRALLPLGEGVSRCRVFLGGTT